MPENFAESLQTGARPQRGESWRGFGHGEVLGDGVWPMTEKTEWTKPVSHSCIHSIINGRYVTHEAKEVKRGEMCGGCADNCFRYLREYERVAGR